MALEEYRQKRRFDRSPEPTGAGEGGAAAGSGLRYVIQKHAARRLHYDFRLELDGRLLSWAVPKGPSLNPKDRHLAVRVEDHPLDYGDFEGTIPPGEYGAGTVELWDRGTWEPEGDPHQALEKGDLKFTLHGEKLKGSWVLVRMKPRPVQAGADEWLLIKHRDEFAVDGDGQVILREQDRSVASGRTLEDLRLSVADAPGARPAGELPRFVRPELAGLAAAAPRGTVWLHEIKFDGYRALGRVDHGRVQMYSRSEGDWTEPFRPIAAELAALPAETALLDGEVVAQLPDGTTSFQELQKLLGAGTPAAHSRPAGTADAAASGMGGRRGRSGRLLYFVFDLLYLDGYDLLESPVETRKELLRRLVAGLPGDREASRIQYSEHVVGGGREFLEQACRLGLEGVVSKKAGSPYRPGSRGAEWRKAKCRQEQEFVVGGFTDPAGSRIGFGALLLGVYEKGKLRYVGRVGTGFDDQILRTLGDRLRGLEAGEAPFALAVERAPRGAHWVQPRLVAEVAFAEWTRNGGLRHPSFKGLREDKAAADVTQERAAAPAPDGPSTPPLSLAPVVLTHPERVLWPADGITKEDLAYYYELAAPWMLPYVAGRPLALVRCLEGVDEVPATAGQAGGQPVPCFFQKHPGPDFKGPFEMVTIVESEGPRPYLTITEPDSLTALAQKGVLEIHVWGATWPDIERPDMLVFDFDPDPAVQWRALVAAAELMRDVLGDLGLRTFVKTTGGKGLHVVAPIAPREEWPVIHDFCKAIAKAFVAAAPDRYTANMRKAKRTAKIYVDYVRNTRGSTSVAPYSTRAKEHATLSVPLRWEELNGAVRPDSFTLKNIGERLDALTTDPWEGYHDARRNQTITEAMLRQIGVSV